MPTLFLLRHAKSSWTDADLEDFDRPLANRGIKACAKVGPYLRARKIRPELVLCSTARRARETLGLLLPHFEGENRILMEDSLYTANDEAVLMERLRRIPASVDKAMLIGHNPTIQDLALMLVGDGKQPDRAALEEKFPTAALAEIHIPTKGWGGMEAGGGTLKRFQVPRKLEETAQ